MKKFLLISFFILTIFTVLCFENKLKAEIINHNITREVIVNSDFAEIIEIRERVLNTKEFTAELTPDNFLITILNPDKTTQGKKLLEEEIRAAKIYDEKNSLISFTFEFNQAGDIIIRPNKSKKLTFGEKAYLRIEYRNPNIVFSTGMLKDLFIGGFSEDFKFTSQTETLNFLYRIKINKQLGEIGLIQPEKNIRESGNYYQLEYTGEELLGETIWVQIGKKQIYEFSINQSFEKTSDIPITFNTFKIIVPRDISSGYINQSVFFTKVEPAPHYAQKDILGNYILTFKVPSTRSGEIKINGYAIVNKVPFNTRLSGSLDDLPLEIISANTSEGKFWEVNNSELQKVALEIKNNVLSKNFAKNEEIYQITKATYDYVIDKIDYSLVKKYGLNERQGALKTLQGVAAVCMEYSDLFITLLRSMGVPARAAFGHAYSPIQYSTFTEGDKTINHQWAEVFLPLQNQWIPVDTTWGESGVEVIGGDINRFYLHITSKDPETPSPLEIQYVGSLEFEKEQKFLVIPVKETIEEGVDFTFFLDKYPILDEQQETVNNIRMSIELLFNSINTEIDTAFFKLLKIDDYALLNLIKIIFFVLFILSIIGLVMLLRSLKRKLLQNRIKKKISFFEKSDNL